MKHSMARRPAGVYWSIVIAESLVGIIGIVLFRRGGWKKTKV